MSESNYTFRERLYQIITPIALAAGLYAITANSHPDNSYIARDTAQEFIAVQEFIIENGKPIGIGLGGLSGLVMGCAAAMISRDYRRRKESQ